jgi:DNA-binding beta-propeller fold protein YncE
MAWRRARRARVLAVALLIGASTQVRAAESFWNFESGHVRPLALFAGDALGWGGPPLLFAVDTPGNRLSIFRVESSGLTLLAEVPVGLEPVAVAARQAIWGPQGPVKVVGAGDHQLLVEAWVVNHVSDSVSIVVVDLRSPKTSHVARTLLLCDEPRDVVFAGRYDDFTGNPDAFPGKNDARAFVSTARRGQNCRGAGGVPVDPKLDQPGVPHALVQVFDGYALGAALGGTPIAAVELFGDTPRALAVSPDGKTVYAAVFLSGNRTTALTEAVVSAGGGLPDAPMVSPYFPRQFPRTGLVVKRTPAGDWEGGGKKWSVPDDVAFDLPDQDVFLIDAEATPPAVRGSVSGVGTVLFNMVTRPPRSCDCGYRLPSSNVCIPLAPIRLRWVCPRLGVCYPTLSYAPCPPALYVSNLEARNQVRFETELQGHVTESRITRVQAGVSAHHLNPHVNYSTVPSPQADVDESIAFPMGMAISSDGKRLYVADLGSDQLAIFETADLDRGMAGIRTLVPVGGGPTGVVLDERNDRLYVMNRFDQSISIVAPASQPALAKQIAVQPLRYDPSPDDVKKGRRLLYDARHTSAHGDAACASCHVFGDLDGLAWDLGNPKASEAPNPNPFRFRQASGKLHPMKGPMTTQSLRGLADARAPEDPEGCGIGVASVDPGPGPMHWRADRFNPSASLDEQGAFEAFLPAFEGLLGRMQPLSTISSQQMIEFAKFALTLRYPPNPIRALDDVPTAAQQRGETFFRKTGTVNKVFPAPPQGAADLVTCACCHRLPLGTDGFSSFEFEPQDFKIPHLRNLYQKVGMFGFPDGLPTVPTTGYLGDQVRGFGFLHDGSIATIHDFLRAPVFTNFTDSLRRDVEAFLLAFDTGLKPAVGQQVTIWKATIADPTLVGRLELLLDRASRNDCELVAKAVVNGVQRGFVRESTGIFRGDQNQPVPSWGHLVVNASSPVTFTCVPPGSGQRIGIDRDADGVLDGLDVDPADPSKP